MPKNQGGKGNPASRRMSNPKRKARRERCWANGEKRKQERRVAAEIRHNKNVMRALEGEPTPWEVACRNRAQARAVAFQGKHDDWHRKRSVPLGDDRCTACANWRSAA